MTSHLRLHCDACCGHDRVAFHWLGSDTAQTDGVPNELTEALDPYRSCMRGTRNTPVRCMALNAVIGQYSRCRIHPQRPSVCRAVNASWEHGQPDPQCDTAGQAHGLPRLRPQDWLTAS